LAGFGYFLRIIWLFRAQTTWPPWQQAVKGARVNGCFYVLKAAFKGKKLIKMALFWFWITHKQRLLETADTCGTISQLCSLF
jgi:hypothetical protein